VSSLGVSENVISRLPRRLVLEEELYSNRVTRSPEEQDELTREQRRREMNEAMRPVQRVELEGDSFFVFGPQNRFRSGH